MTKKTLMISPFPSHPPTAGSNTRILQFARALRNMGHDVHFLLCQQSGDYDEEAMSRFWGEKLYNVTPTYKYAQRSFLRRVAEKLKDLSGLKLSALDDWYYDIDDWYDPSLDTFLTELSRRVQFDVVLVEYVFYSAAFRHFNSDVLKLIDTHDVFANRHLKIPKFADGREYKWYTATERGEAKGLSRADVVIAIQPGEQVYFKQQTAGEVVSIGHLIMPERLADQAEGNPTLLLVGAMTQDNLEGLQYFASEVLPRVLERHPHARLLLAGNICKIAGDIPGCRKLGVVEDLKSLYESATVVINPAQTGTGLAIKSIEALSHARPVVATRCGARGLESSHGRAMLVAKNAEEFASHINHIIEDGQFRKDLSDRAFEYAQVYCSDNWNRFRHVLGET